MQFGDVPTPLLGADPEGLVRDAEDGVGLRIREPRCPLGLLEGASNFFYGTFVVVVRTPPKYVYADVSADIKRLRGGI